MWFSFWTRILAFDCDRSWLAYETTAKLTQETCEWDPMLAVMSPLASEKMPSPPVSTAVDLEATSKPSSSKKEKEKAMIGKDRNKKNKNIHSSDLWHIKEKVQGVK